MLVSRPPGCPARCRRWLRRPCSPGRTPVVVLLVIALPGLHACGVTVHRPATEGGEWMSRDEFRSYAEQVFRRHNAVESELLFLLPELEERDPERYRRLSRAEEAMLDACAPLVEIAQRRSRELSIGFFKRLHLPPKITACDRETRRVEQLLEG